MRGGHKPVAEPAASGGETGVSEHRVRVGQGRDTASEPDPDVCAASVHRLEDGGRLAFLPPLADQRRPRGADIAKLGAALAEDGNSVNVEQVDRLEAQPDHVARRAENELHTPVALAIVLVWKVDAGNGRG